VLLSTLPGLENALRGGEVMGLWRSDLAGRRRRGGCGHEATIAALTAERDDLQAKLKAMALSFLRDATIATLTAERDDYKAHFEVCNANRQRLDDRVKYLEEQMEELREEVVQFQNAAGA